MAFPRQIEPCPIKEVVAEIRFETSIPGEAVFGIVYNAVKEQYSNFEKLPILQIPEAVREVDQNLIYQPHYRLRKENFLVQIGPRTVSVAVIEEYPGWSNFLPEIEYVFSKFNELRIIDKVTRFAIRYTNFFDFNIFKEIKLNISMDNVEVDSDNIYFRTVLGKGKFSCTLQISNDAVLHREDGDHRGSLLDIDTSLASAEGETILQINSLLTEAHDVEKKLFFELLKPEFLDTLKPIY